jgi:branched-chain amino acid transport system permease protein
MKPPSRSIVLQFGALAALAVLPHVAPLFYVQLVSKVMVLAIFAMSLDLLVGFTGLVSFGHAAFWGLGGYALALLSPQDAAASLWWSLPAAMAVAAAAALAIGWFCIRTNGVYFIMITLAFTQMLYFFFNDSKRFGGSDGTFVNVRPTLNIGSFALGGIETKIGFYYLALVFLVVVYLFLAMLLRAPFGRVIKAIRINEPRMRALGFPTPRYKLVSFVIAGALAGLAGYLNAAQFGFVSPADLGWRHSGEGLMIVILGGVGTLYGSIVGTFVMVLLQDTMAGLTEHWQMVMGVFVVLVVVLLPQGIAGLLRRVGRLVSFKEAAGE